MGRTFDYDVFLSHNTKDKPRVRRLAERLKSAGVRVWFDDWIIKPGDDVYLAIEHGLEAARVQVLCLSPAALGSDWVGLERSTVLFRDPSNAGRRFIPLLLTDCELPDTLRRYKYVDFRNDTDHAFQELLSACRIDFVVKPASANRAANRAAPRNGQELRTSKSRNNPEPVHKSPPGLRLRHCLRGHDEFINRLSWAPDGVRFASSAHDGLIRIWSSDTGQLIRTLRTAKRDIDKPHWSILWSEGAYRIAWTPAWSPDGSMIACGYGDGAVRLWSAATGDLLQTLKGHANKVNNVAWSPDGRLLASSADDALVKLWDTAQWICVATLSGHRSGVNNVAWHPEGQILASGSLDGTITLWDRATHTRLRTLSGHQDIVITITWSPDGRTLASSSGDETIRLWNPSTGLATRILEGHHGAVSCVAYSADGKIFASKGIRPDSTVRFWSVGSWETVAILEEKAGEMWFAGIAFHPTQMLFASLDSADTAIRIWEVDSNTLLGISPPLQSVQYSSAKIVLIGESAVGKTTLAHRLIDDRYILTDSTHGMNVWRLELPLPESPSLERDVLLWDLAGQDDYRLIHQLFLADAALALLLINPHKDDPFADAADWLKALSAVIAVKGAKHDIPKLLISTRLDVGGIKVSQEKVDRFLKEHAFQGYLTTSAKRGDNCSDNENGNQPSALKQLIAKHIPWNDLPRTSTPRLLAAIKNTIVAMRDESDIRLMRFSELAQRLEQALPEEEFGDADVRTAVTLMANHGLVRTLKFGDLVLLRPDLLNGYSAAIIRAARMHQDEIGCVTEEAIYRGDFDFTGVERLNHRPDEELLLRALVQTLLDHSLCIRESEGGEWLLIFPSQYRRDREIPEHPEVFVSYTFTGELQTIYTTLIVRLWYSQIFGQKELWKNAAEFWTSKGNRAGLVFEKARDGIGKLSLFFDMAVSDELKVVFVEFVHRHLSKYGRDLLRERRYVCECGEPVTNLAAVIKRQRSGIAFITCQVCDRPVAFMDHIEQRLGTDRVAQKVVAIEETERRARDAQSEEQGLIGHMMTICADANQIFRPVTMFDHGIDGEVEFKDDAGRASGRKIYVQLKSGASYLRKRKRDGKDILDLRSARHLKYWISQPVDVYLVVRNRAGGIGPETIRWMNVTRYLKSRSNKRSRQIEFDGQKLDASAVWNIRDEFFPPPELRRASG